MTLIMNNRDSMYDAVPELFLQIPALQAYPVMDFPVNAFPVPSANR